MDQIVSIISQELNVKSQQVSAAITLLDEGATVPFISRYRKEVTGALDDTQLRTLEERLGYLRDLEDRRNSILKSIEEQDKLTPQLKTSILAADTRTRLEDLYLPYKQKRKTRGQTAVEAGLLPLADALLENPQLNPEQEAAAYLNPEQDIADATKALEGARYILMERFAEDAELVGRLRDYLWEHGQIHSTVIEGKAGEAEKFQDYFDHSEAIKSIPSHRSLALLRGRREAVLSLVIDCGDPDNGLPHPCETQIARHWQVADQERAADSWLKTVVRWTWRIKLYPSLETSLLTRIREAAETEAIRVFSDNLKDLLLAAPAGNLATIGLDPGLRTGVKVAVVDDTGKLVDHTTIYPTPPQNKIAESEHILGQLIEKHGVKLVAIGNGTASRETDRFVGGLMKAKPGLGIRKIMVSEAGASVYSASETAAREFPDLDVTIRGAVSIARRLQDPLSELVKIEPKSIGVGQYQHDVSQAQLTRQLDTVVEDCVNSVGVDVNTASIPLLAKVSGLTRITAENIVHHRDANGKFQQRIDLKSVPRLGDKTFEQAAGFLRIVGGKNPLDASGVHPEAYGVAERIASTNKRELSNAMGDKVFLKQLKPMDYTDAQFGELTVRDIINELEKPGRDPRGEFKTAAFSDGVEKLSDLQPEMILEGCVTNVTNFGAFVDVGVHQDGLVHISALSHSFVKDPRTVVKAGDIVKVKVMEVDVQRKRIALSMRLDDQASEHEQRGAERQERRGGGQGRDARPSNKHMQKHSGKDQKPAAVGSLGQALLNARKR